MIPEWIVEILKSLGLAGAVIFFLLLTTAGLVAYIRTLHAKADKVYGYRLTERDTLNKTLSDTARVLEDVLQSANERNELTEEQAELIAKQAAAFELLKVTVLAQYDNIKDHNSTTAQVVSSMADAIRSLSAIVIENRSIAKDHVSTIQLAMSELKSEIVRAVGAAGDKQVTEMRNLLGNVTRIEHRRKKTT